MRRREFIAGLGGAAGWPLAGRTQQAGVPVIGFLHTGSPEVTPSLVAGFHRGLDESGFIDGRNVIIEFRWAHNDNDRLPELAADLVRRRVDVIATPNGELPALAAKAATGAIPIVFNGIADPVKLGLVASYNRRRKRLAMLPSRTTKATRLNSCPCGARLSQQANSGLATKLGVSISSKPHAATRTGGARPA